MDEEVNCNNFPFDRPLSPVLSTGKVNRTLFNSRRFKKKARKCLTNQLESLKENNNISSTSTSTSTIHQLEESTRANFKRPTAPAPRRIGHSQTSHSKPQGFQTASGKEIIVSECDVRHHSELLFRDILEPAPSNDITQRQNKFSFLTKAGSKRENRLAHITPDKGALKEVSQKKSPRDNDLFSEWEISDSQIVAAFDNIPDTRSESSTGLELPNHNFNNTAQESESGGFLGFTEQDYLISRNVLNKLLSSLYEIEAMNGKSDLVTGTKGCSALDVGVSNSRTSEQSNMESESLSPIKKFKSDGLPDHRTTSCVAVGFQTASGNKIHISEKSMEKVSKIFENNELHILDKCTTTTFIDTSNSAIKDKETCTTDHPLSTCTFKSGIININANNKRDCHQNDASFQNQNKDASSSNKEVFTTGFKSGLGAAINIKRDSFQRALNLYQNQDTGPGISTNESLNKHQNKEKPVPIIENNFITTGFKSASGVTIDVKEDSFQQAVISFKSKHQEELEDFESKDELDEAFQDFLMLDDIDVPAEIIELCENKAKSSGTNTDFRVPKTVTEQVLTTTPNPNNTSVSNKCRKRLGISMACRKQIRISENQLEKAKLLFKDTLKCPSPDESCLSFTN